MSETLFMHNGETLQKLCGDNFCIMFRNFVIDMIVKRTELEVFHGKKNIIFVLEPSKEVDKYFALGKLYAMLVVLDSQVPAP
jgi:hypothetical protein